MVRTTICMASVSDAGVTYGHNKKVQLNGSNSLNMSTTSHVEIGKLSPWTMLK